MVGPIPESDRASFRRRLKAGIATLVAASGALVAVQAEAGLAGVLGGAAAGLTVGAALAWYIVPDGPMRSGSELSVRVRDNPFADGGRGSEGGNRDRDERERSGR
ncbi:MAG: hypothetical protein ABEJ40_07765 [Haloarculaceae archaeon]